MTKEKIIKLGIGLCLIIFIISYFIEKNGYYEYRMQSNKEMTKEQIKAFEEDIKQGKDVDVKDYMTSNSIDYSNNFTKGTYEVSKTVNKYLKKSIELVFSSVNNLIN